MIRKSQSTSKSRQQTHLSAAKNKTKPKVIATVVINADGSLYIPWYQEKLVSTFKAVGIMILPGEKKLILKDENGEEKDYHFGKLQCG